MDLFEKAQSFLDGDLILDPEMEHYNEIAQSVENLIFECFGEEPYGLVKELIEAHYQIMKFLALHYFEQGYLAGKADRRKRAL